MEDGAEARRTDLEMLALSANVGGKHGIQHAAWWKIVLAVAVIVGVAGVFYHITAARTYTGQVEWTANGPGWRLRLGTTETVVDFDASSVDFTVDGAPAALPPGPLPRFLSTAPARVSWTPYLTKRHGAGGEVVALDLEPRPGQ